MNTVLSLVSREYGGVLLATSAPGRVDFLNTHQDYKGLPVVPIAVNLRCYAFAVKTLEGYFRVESLNLREEGSPDYVDEFGIPAISFREGRCFGNYMRAVVAALQNHLDKEFRIGLHVVIWSNIPIGSGLASSAALEVSSAKLLDAFYGVGLSRQELGELCFQAENVYCGIPCGRLDQYSSAFGGAILLYPKPPVRAEELPLASLGLVVVDSGIRHSVAEIHPKRQEEINRGLKALMENPDVPDSIKAKLGYRFDEPSWDSIKLEELRPYLNTLDEAAAKRIKFTILMNESTKRAVAILKSGKGNIAKKIGAVVNEQHELLRDLYDVSLSELESIRDAMLSAGAYGAKISGAGMGGALLAVTPQDRNVMEDVLDAALEAGAARGWILRVDCGARVERLY